MKIFFASIAIIILCFGLPAPGHAAQGATSWEYLKDPATVAQLKSFVAEKKAQADAAPGEAAPGFAPFFAAAGQGNWLALSNAFEAFRKHAGQYEHSGTNDERLRGVKWQAVIEIWGTMDAFYAGNEKYSALYASNIINSIPPGSVYFGGTDPGRFLITGMQKSQAHADPFFTLTQNALADGTYLDYVRGMYGAGIQLPAADDLQNCFQAYIKDATFRQQHNQLEPGEIFQTNAGGPPHISGLTAVMKINGLLVKIIFERNPGREFYLEQSFALDWTYPYLEPHGLIFKINRQPLTAIPDDIVRTDRDFWTRSVSSMIGDWLKPETPVGEVAAFADKVFNRHDYTGFGGDPGFVQDPYSHKTFGKERTSIAGLYAWRADHAADAMEKERMTAAADFAYRQAWALCPYSVEATSNFAKFLKSQGRHSDAVLVARTAARMSDRMGDSAQQVRDLETELEGEPK